MKNFYLRFTIFCILFSGALGSYAQCSCSGGTAPNTVSYLQKLNTTNAASSTISFPQFDPSLGTLVCVTLQDTISGVTNTTIENSGSQKSLFSFLLTVANGINAPGISVTETFNKNYGPDSLAAGAGISYGPDSLFKNVKDSTCAKDTSGYQGKGSVNCIYTLNGGLTALAGGLNYNAQIVTNYWGSFRLTYNYCQAANNHCMHFKATKSKTSANLQWQCANEQKDVNYEIQCGKNGYQFSTVGHTPCATDGLLDTVSYQYQYTLAQTDKDKLYFRIKRTDSVGNVTYSPVRWVNLDVQGIAGCNIYPNPARSSVVVEFDQMLTGNFSVELVNGTGSCVQRSNLILSNNNQMNLNVSGLKKGLYMVFIKDPEHNQQIVSKVVVQ
jgi:type IX secretion system substrate protein